MVNFVQKGQFWAIFGNFGPKMAILIHYFKILISCEDYQFLNSMSEKIHAIGDFWRFYK
jgi:hypothetical protein